MDMKLTAEVYFAQRLACNEPELAAKALKKVGKWLAVQSVKKNAFTEDSFMKLWEGIYSYFLNTDKPLVQEQKADVICSYIHVFKTAHCSFMYIDTFFQTMARKWLAVDHYRIEKFMMLVRKFLHQTYQLLKNLNWELKWIKRFRKVLKKTVLSISSENTPLGLKLHISDIYMEELAKVGTDEITHEKLQLFLQPYCRILIESDESIFLESIAKDVFLYLINQNADENRFHKFPMLNFDADAVQKLLMKCANIPGVRKRNRKIIYDIIKKYEDYKNCVSSMDRVFSDKTPVKKLRKRTIERAALNLLDEELSYSKEKEETKRKKKLSEEIIDL